MKPTTVRIDDNVLGRLDNLAEALNRSRSWIINQAIEKFVDYEEWFAQEIQAGLSEVEQGKIATDEEVRSAFSQWGVDAR